MKAITRAAMTMVTTIVVARLPPGGGESRPDETGAHVVGNTGAITRIPSQQNPARNLTGGTGSLVTG